MGIKILYEDNHIIAVYKPASLLVQPASPKTSSQGGGDKTGDSSLMDEVKEYLKDKYKKPGNVFLGLVHRLDRPVSGIVLFAKTSKGAARLSEQFRNNEISKTYHAVVEGKLDSKKGKLVHYLKKDEERRIAIISDSLESGYDRSELSYKTILVTSHYSLITVHLITGRFHQIRAQFSHIGHPIVGDKKYRAKNAAPFNGIALCAVEIEFRTATTDEIRRIKIDYPGEWNKLLD